MHEDEDGQYWISSLVLFLDLYALCKTLHQDSSCFLACETHQKAEGHMLTANSGNSEADRSDRCGAEHRVDLGT